MATRLYPHLYGEQIETYTGQVMRALSGFQVVDAGVTRNGQSPQLERVPVAFGAMDRIIAAILNKDKKEFVNHKLPMIGVALSNISIDQEVAPSRRHIQSTVYKDDQGTYNQVDRKPGPGLILTYEANVLASSMLQLFEIIEQMMLAFHNDITIQKSNDIFDENYRSTLVMQDLTSDVTYPVGTQQRMVAMTVSFEMNVRLSYPRGFNTDYVNTITANIYDEESDNLVEEVIVDEDDV